MRRSRARRTEAGTFNRSEWNGDSQGKDLGRSDTGSRVVAIHGVVRDVHKCSNYIEYTKPLFIHSKFPNASIDPLESLRREVPAVIPTRS